MRNHLPRLALTFSIGFVGCTDSEEDKIATATATMKRQVANDVSLAFEGKSQKLFDPGGTFYFVCGQVTVNQPGITNNEKQRYILTVNRDAHAA